MILASFPLKTKEWQGKRKESTSTNTIFPFKKSTSREVFLNVCVVLLSSVIPSFKS